MPLPSSTHAPIRNGGIAPRRGAKPSSVAARLSLGAEALIVLGILASLALNLEKILSTLTRIIGS